MYLDIFSARLKDLMELEGTSIRALSLKICADRKSIRHWLQGKHFPTLRRARENGGIFRSERRLFSGLGGHAPVRALPLDGRDTR